MKYYFKLALLLLVGLNYKGVTQNSKALIVFRTSNSSDEKLKKTLSETLATLNNCQDKDCRASVYHLVASIQFALSNNDSIWYYLEKSYTESPEWLCKYVDLLDEAYQGSKIRIYFATNFSPKWLEMHRIRCKNYKNNIQIVLEPDLNESKNMIYQTEILEMLRRDQKFRNSGDWLNQDSLDLINRTILDRLFDNYGFPTKQIVSLKCRQNIWLVIHHSIDCDWNKKWIIRYLNAYQNGDIESNFLDQTIKRFFEIDKGFCKDGRDEYIKLLKQTYPSEYGKLFGYNSF